MSDTLANWLRGWAEKHPGKDAVNFLRCAMLIERGQAVGVTEDLSGTLLDSHHDSDDAARARRWARTHVGPCKCESYKHDAEAAEIGAPATCGSCRAAVGLALGFLSIRDEVRCELEDAATALERVVEAARSHPRSCQHHDPADCPLCSALDAIPKGGA